MHTLLIKQGERIKISETVTIVVLAVNERGVKFVIDAPEDVVISLGNAEIRDTDEGVH